MRPTPTVDERIERVADALQERNPDWPRERARATAGRIIRRNLTMIREVEAFARGCAVAGQGIAVAAANALKDWDRRVKESRRLRDAGR